MEPQVLVEPGGTDVSDLSVNDGMMLWYSEACIRRSVASCGALWRQCGNGQSMTGVCADSVNGVFVVM